MKYGIRFIRPNTQDKPGWTGAWFKSINNEFVGCGNYTSDINVAYRGVAAAKEYWKSTFDFWVEEYI